MTEPTDETRNDLHNTLNNAELGDALHLSYQAGGGVHEPAELINKFGDGNGTLTLSDATDPGDVELREDPDGGCTLFENGEAAITITDAELER